LSTADPKKLPHGVLRRVDLPQPFCYALGTGKAAGFGVRGSEKRMTGSTVHGSTVEKAGEVHGSRLEKNENQLNP
jgi:hypothetical protein